MIYKLLFFIVFFSSNLKALTVSSIIKDCQNKKRGCTYSKIERNNKRALYVPDGQGSYRKFIVDIQDLRGTNIPLFQRKEKNIDQVAVSATSKVNQKQMRSEKRESPHPPITTFSRKSQTLAPAKKTISKIESPHPPLVVYSRKKPLPLEKKSNHHQILSSIESKQDRDQIYNDYKIYESLDFNQKEKLNETEIKRILFNHFLYLNHQVKHFTKDLDKQKKYEYKIANLSKSKQSLKDRFYKKYKKNEKGKKRFNSYYKGIASLDLDKKQYPLKKNSKQPVFFNQLLSNVLGVFKKSPKAFKQMPQIPNAASLNEAAIVNSLRDNMPEITSATVSQKSTNTTEASDCIDCEQNKRLVNKENKNFKDQFYQCFDDVEKDEQLCSFRATNAAFYEGKHNCRKHLKKLGCAKGCFKKIKDKNLKQDEKKQEFHKIIDDFYVKNKNFPSLGSRFLSCIAIEKENKTGALGLRTLVGCNNDKNQRLSRNGKNFTASGLFQITRGTLKEVFEDEAFWNYLESVSPARGYKASRRHQFEVQRDKYLNDPFLQIKAAEAVLYKKMTYLFKGSNAHKIECVDRFANNEYLKYLSLQLYYGSDSKKANQKYAKPIQSCGQKEKFSADSLKASKNQLIKLGKNLNKKGCILKQKELKQVDFL